MIVRCAGCGSTVSEWAAKCARCGHLVDDSIAASRDHDPGRGGPGEAVQHGLLLGDGPTDPQTSIWSRTADRTAGRAAPVWERTGLAPAIGSIDSAPDAPDAPLVADGTGDGVGDDSADDVDAPHTGGGRRWRRVAVGTAVAVMVVGVGWVAARPHGGADSHYADPFTLAPIEGTPELRWTVDRVPPAFTAVRSDDTLYVTDDGTGPVVVEAYDISSGARRWRVELSSDSGFVGLLPTLEGVVASGESRNFALLDETTGEQRWESDAGGYVITPSAEQRALVYLTPTPTSEPALGRLDVTTGAVERLGGPFWNSGGELATVDDDAIVTYDLESAQETGRWEFDGDRIEGVARLGDVAVVARGGQLVGVAADGERWSIELGSAIETGFGAEAGSIGQLLALDDHRLLVLMYGERVRLSLVDIGEEASLRWTVDANLMRVLSSEAALVEREARSVLVRFGDDGLEDISELGSLEDGGLWGIMDGGVMLFREEDEVVAIRPDGSEVWTLDVDASTSMVLVDRGLVVVADGKMTFYD